jgi:hypothetical protein
MLKESIISKCDFLIDVSGIDTHSAFTVVSFIPLSNKKPLGILLPERFELLRFLFLSFDNL